MNDCWICTICGAHRIEGFTSFHDPRTNETLRGRCQIHLYIHHKISGKDSDNRIMDLFIKCDGNNCPRMKHFFLGGLQ